MKTLEAPRQLHSFGTGTRKAYSVASNAAMMSLLSDKLYTDKVMAVIRELSTNAYDSHVVAGVANEPFDIHLPTKQSLMFIIRDYGTGMPPEKVMDMYCTYGISDKTDTNDLQGCMGIGSKSPFAYADQFTSISYYNGMMYTWFNAKDDHGMPIISPATAQPTDQPNGFQVQFAVSLEDISEFHSKSQTVFRPFPVNPNIITSPYSGWDATDFATQAEMDFDRWQLIGGSKSFVRMGCVDYPIDIEHFEDIKEPTKKSLANRRQLSWYRGGGYRHSYNSKYAQLLDCGILLKCNIGEVEMDGSREGLQYHKATIAAVKSMLDDILSDMGTIVNERISHVKTYYDACVLFTQMVQGEMREASKVCGLTTATWKGRQVKTEILIPYSHYSLTEIVLIGKNSNRASGVEQQRNMSSFIHVCNRRKIGFLIQDIKAGGHVAAQRKINDGTYDTIYLFKFKDDTTPNQAALLDLIGITPSQTELVSKLRTVSTTTKIGSHAKYAAFVLDTPGVIKYRYVSLRRVAQSWKPHQVDLEVGGVYLPLLRFQPHLRNDDIKALTLSRVATILRYLQNLGIVIPTIVGVRHASSQKFDVHQNWIRLDKWMIEQTIKLWTNADQQYLLMTKQEYDSYTHDIQKIKNLGETMPDIVVSTTIFGRFVRYCQKLYETHGGSGNQSEDTLLELVRELGLQEIDVVQQLRTETFETLNKQYITRYPMLRLINLLHTSDNDAQIIADYIKSIETQ